MEHMALLSHLRTEAPGAAAQAQAIGAPLYYGMRTRWFSDPSACFSAMLSDLQRAEKRIWLAGTVRRGVMWETMLDVLRQRAARGADVRVDCDGRLPLHDVRRLEQMRIHCRVRHRFGSSLALLIDDETLYAGCMEICDAQIGLRCRRGDRLAGMLRLYGSAAASVGGRFFPDDLKERDLAQTRESGEYSYVSSFSGRSGTVLNLIRRAERSIDLMAPRLDGQVRRALNLAAASGIAVWAVVGHPPPRMPPDIQLARFPGRIQGTTCCADGRTAVLAAGGEGIWLHGRGAAEIAADLREIPGLRACEAGYTLLQRRDRLWSRAFPGR